MTTDALYRSFFRFYAFIHVLGGVLIWIWPALLANILTEPLSRGAATIAGFLSIMVGCGFATTERLQAPEGRRAAVRVTFICNLVNGAGHLLNVATGASPLMLAPGVIGGLGGFAVVLVILDRRLAR